MNTSQVKAKQAADKQKALCVATRCATIAQFITTFHRFCEDSSFFVSTLAMRPVGLETAFSIQLEDKTPVLRGLCVVVEAWATPANRFGRPGVRLDVKRLTNESLEVWSKLQAARPAEGNAELPATPTEFAPRVPTTAVPSPTKKVEIPAPPPFPRGTRDGAPPPARPTSAPLDPVMSAPEPSNITSKIPPIAPLEDKPTLAGTALEKFPGAEQRVGGTSPIVRFEPPRATPSIGISTSSIAHSNTAVTSDRTPAQRAAYAEPPVAPSVAKVTPASIGEAQPVVAKEVERTPGSSYVLPANPLMNISDQSLEGFIDCALYEETGNFFRTPGYEDSLVDVGDLAPPSVPNSLNPVPALRVGGVSDLQPSYIGPMPQSTAPRAFSSQPPIPMLLSQVQGAHVLSLAKKRVMVILGSALASMVVIAIVAIVVSGSKATKPVVATVAIKAVPVAQAAPIARAVPVAKAAPIARADLVPVQATPTKVAVVVPQPAPIAEATVVRAKPPVVDDGDPEVTASDSPPVVGSGPCRMTINSTPAGSIVRVDDRTVGPSPVTVDGPCKRTKIEVKHPRYALGQKFVNLAADRPTSVEVPLNRPTHAVTVITFPAGATVSIGGRRAGTTPTSINLMGFTTQALTIEKKGYRRVVQKFYSKAVNGRVTVKLSRGK